MGPYLTFCRQPSRQSGFLAALSEVQCEYVHELCSPTDENKQHL